MTFNDWLYFKVNAIRVKIRAINKFAFFKRMDIVFGKNVIVKRNRGHHSFGKKLMIFDNSIFEVFSKNASIKIGDNCFFSYGVILACAISIELGNNVWIGEYTSIRDSTHNFSSIHPMGEGLPDKRDPVKIGNNVWIGRGCLILPGTIIEDNVLIAANSVVKGLCNRNSLYAGNPARFIKAISQ